MQLGFAMLCAGSIREKNVKNVLLWNLLDSAGGAFGFWSIGYALAYGGDDPTSTRRTFMGNAGFFLTGDTDMEFWFFQFAFACALSSIVAGTIAERCQMMVSVCSCYLNQLISSSNLHHTNLLLALCIHLSLGVSLLQYLFVWNCLPCLRSRILECQRLLLRIRQGSSLGNRCD